MKITRKPNPQLRKIVLEETNDGRDVIRYLKSVLMTIEDGVSLFGLRHKDYARTHKIAAARILARLGLEEGKRYLDRNYVQTPFRRVHPEEEDGPKRDMAASTAQLYRMARQKTRDGADIIIHFIEVMKGCHPEYKPHLRMAAAKELIRQIEFDYDYEDEPGETPTASVASTDQTHPEHPDNPVNPDSDKITAHHQNHTNHSSDNRSDQPNPVNPTHPDSDKITAHHQNHTNHSSDPNPISNSELKIEDSPTVSLADIQRRMHIKDGSVHYRDYAAQHADEGESIFQSIIRRAAYRRTPQDAKREAEELIGQFELFMEERDPQYRPFAVPDNLITSSLTGRMTHHENWTYDPADFYDLDQDYFYYCMCLTCEACDELNYFFEFMRELEEEYEDP